MKRLFLILFLGFFGLSFAQEYNFRLLGMNYSYHYDNTKGEFSICSSTTSTTQCNKYKIKEKEFQLVELLDNNEAYFEEQMEDLLSEVTKNISITTTSTLERIKQEKELHFKTLVDFTENHNDKISDTTSLKTVAKHYIETSSSLQLKNFYQDQILKQNEYQFLTVQDFVVADTTSSSTSTQTTATSSTTKLYSISVLKKEKSFWLKINEVGASDKEALGQFALAIEKNEFIANYFKQFDSFSNEEDLNKTHLQELYYKIHDYLDERKIETLQKEFKEQLSDVIESIENEEKTFSGQLILADSFEVEVLINEKTGPFKHKKKKKKDVFKIDRGTIRFFNNRIDNISLYGSLENNPQNKMVLFNEGYSTPMRALNRNVYVKEKVYWKKKFLNDTTIINESRNTLFYPKTKKFIIYSVADALDYLPTDRFNYSVKNQELKLTPNDTIKVEERKIGDYFTGIFFSDFLGLNSTNSNNLIVAEGKIRFPIHLRNWKTITLLDHFSGSVGVSLFNGFNSESKTLQLAKKVEGNLSQNTMIDALNQHLENSQNQPENFDLLVNNNIDASLELSILSQDWKQARTFIHFGYGFRFLRSGVSYDFFETTSTSSPTFLSKDDFQVFSVGHQANLTFEIRPQANIGADFSIGVNYLQTAGTNVNGIEFQAKNENQRNIRIMLDLFALSNSKKSKSGIFFRFGGHYNPKQDRVFPQLMGGFATNLSSFVNKLKTDN